MIAHDADGPQGCARALGERLAAEGFHVLVPDLDSRGDDELPDRRAIGDLDGALGALAARVDVDEEKLAVVGLGRGGTLAFLCGCASSRPSAVVQFAGRVLYDELSAEKPTQPVELALNLGAALLAFYGEADEEVDATQLGFLRAALEQGAKSFELVVYPGAGGRFFDSGAPEYASDASDDAWKRMLGFLREVL